MNPVVEFAIKREQLRVRKESGAPPPWTDDEILQRYRFTNVRRRDDRVSRWLLENVHTQENAQRYAVDNFLLFAALCRQINWPPTLKLLIAKGYWKTDGPIDWKGIGREIDRIPYKSWTGAYMVRAQPGYGGGKGGFVSEFVVGEALAGALPEIKAALITKSREQVHDAWCKAKGWGSFMAGQVIDDLTWTPYLCDSADILTWAPQGPGSLRGLNRVLGLPLKTKHDRVAWCNHLIQLRHEVVLALGAEYQDLTLHDVQNLLCETDKVLRVRANEGRPRAKYKPEVAY